MSISTVHCSFTYPGTSIGVHDVTLSAAEGELVAVIGASGSGKTARCSSACGSGA